MGTDDPVLIKWWLRFLEWYYRDELAKMVLVKALWYRPLIVSFMTVQPFHAVFVEWERGEPARIIRVPWFRIISIRAVYPIWRLPAAFDAAGRPLTALAGEIERSWKDRDSGKRPVRTGDALIRF